MAMTAEATPQRVNGKRFTLLPSNRRKAIDAEVEALEAAFAAASAQPERRFAAHAPAQPMAVRALAAGETQLGLPYGITGCRCSLGYCSRRDCSGEVIFAVNTEFNRVGLPLFPCTSSFAIAQFGRNHNTLIPYERAIWIPGSIGVRNPWGNPNFNGSNGHVWLHKGDGKTTVEEGGRRTGCYRGSVFTKSPHGELVIGMLWPGLVYGPVRAQGDGELILQTKHDGSLKPSPFPGRHAGHMISADGTAVLGVNGGSVKGDQPAADLGKGCRLWKPFPVGPNQSISIARRANNTGLICTRSDGLEESEDYS